ncbi:hypothetical protein DM860_007145 [Cuscuta australis]|uniref:Uncharacterized protein n=1 Tax=Cuscuta australis TaxID=267555 RepID=A0A328EA82_9ASTE|nr:hypothetical protein DM860_007145 [Cuscuta australis]
MKASSTIVASVLAASTVALAAPSGYSEANINLFHSEGHPCFSCQPSQRHGVSSSSSNTEKLTSVEKFAPRFDGLRFIETLITAHR